ncbi:AraC family transcriptional regulator [uncultured Mailhella sp.]|uniref:AraC family transcriptional regulator n=1 Tax=uncultured Mailhella sp. TaxID=1981031 RepID=UPI0025D78BC8|nr:AraC family transcriptional regulator [uncultured Mailhella sp.]
MSNEPQKNARVQQELKEKLLHYLDRPGIVSTAIGGLHLVRREEGSTPEQCFEKPLVGLVVQGTKHSVMAGQEYVYAQGQSVVAGVDMPIASYVEKPTPEHPFLFVYLYLDKKLLASLSMEMKDTLAPRDEESPGVSVADADADISEMFLRLVTLLEKPEQIPFRAPMMLRELHYLLLISPHGGLLRQLNTPGTQNHQVLQAINWIHENYRHPLRVDDLARKVNMSASNLHRHFKLLTGLSPLQYQKQLRLYEAQRLMLLEHERASSAAISVGYESVTQFNREYKRVFGEPPLRDMNRRRLLSGLS